MTEVFSPYRERCVAPGQRVQVYRNVNKAGVTYSVREVSSGLVLGHTSELLLSDCTFTVKQAGRRRVLEEKRKNVHAWIEGCFVHTGDLPQLDTAARVSYDPYKNNSFMKTSSGRIVTIDSAGLVYLNENGVFVLHQSGFPVP